jgi:HlyD family secretion protein
MKIPKQIILIPLLVLLILFTSACDILMDTGGSTSGEIQASGVVEAIEISLAPEIGGRIAKVFVHEGDRVSLGDTLFEIEDKMLIAQYQQVEAAFRIAQANYELIAAGQTSEQKKASISGAELELAFAKHELDSLYDGNEILAAQSLKNAESLERALENLQNPDLQQALALKAIADAKKSIENTERRFRSVSSSADEADIAAAESQVVLAKDALDNAKEDFEPYENKSKDNLQRANYQSKLAAAQQTYDAAVRNLNALQGTGSEADIAVAEAELAASNAALFEAERDWERIKNGPNESEISLLQAQIVKAYEDFEIYQDGPDPDDLALANARINNAIAQLALAKAEFPTQEDLELAQAQVDLARANLNAINVQLDLIIVKSPINGVVMTRNIEPGEVIQSGMIAMTIAQLDQLTITVYVPEDKYGQINLGDHALLSVDSFPGETFEAAVTRIADRAEYTPRNVQTKEDRQTTVYGIQLSVKDPENRLKPGMPTDVEFGQ